MTAKEEELLASAFEFGGFLLILIQVKHGVPGSEGDPSFLFSRLFRVDGLKVKG